MAEQKEFTHCIRYQPAFIRIQPPTANRPDARGVGCWYVDTVLSIGAVLGRWVAGATVRNFHSH